MKLTSIVASVFLFCAPVLSQVLNVYEIYAIEYARPKSPRAPATDIALGAISGDSVTFSFFVWFLKGDNEKKILVDAGYLEDSSQSVDFMGAYLRPDLALKRISVNADNITDVIITHPHWDHIGGLDLFTKATVWMQKDDFTYFVDDAWQKGASHIGLDKKDIPKILRANREGRLRIVDGDSLEIIPGIRVFTGSKHTAASMHLLVDARNDKVLLASDNSWFYYNLEHLLSVPLTLDTTAYVQEMHRMRTLVPNMDFIVPGHDALVFSRFTPVSEGVVRIR
jgi:glyoxylase-like metal-dependent hydrolase (beta-lactamase superfamily II)